MTAPEFAREQAPTLAAIVGRYREDRDERRRVAAEKPYVPLTVTHPAPWLDKAMQPRWMDLLDGIKTDPVRTVLRAAAREIGWKLYAAGGTSLMGDAAALADDLAPAWHVEGLLDKWWDGIGAEQPTTCRLRGGVWCA